ncbi:MAG: DUF4136 domain-containing protein [Pseudomonadota bacterium]
MDTIRMVFARYLRPRFVAICALVSALIACSGTEVIPDDVSRFKAAAVSDYAWRSEPLGEPKSYTHDRTYQADPIVRRVVDARLKELGYRLVERGQAEFLVEYLASQGVNAGLVSTQASGVYPYPGTSATINRLPDGASIDNAYALGGPVETGNLRLMFLTPDGSQLLWKVSVTAVIENVNRVDPQTVERALGKGLAYVPPAASD